LKVLMQCILANGPVWIQAFAAVGIVILTFLTLIVLRGYAADTKKIAQASVTQTENSQMPFLVIALQPGSPSQSQGWGIENQGFGPAINITFIVGNTRWSKPPLAKGGKHYVHNEVSQAVGGEGIEIQYESLSGMRYRTTITWGADQVIQTQFHREAN
jgi:hypothetical protein